MRRNSQWKKFERVGVLLGILSPMIMGLGMLVAGFGYVGIEGEQYSISRHYVSELGRVGISDRAWVFNLSLTVGGVFAVIFMIVLAYQLKSWLRYPLGLIGLVATVNAALVGVFPMNNLEKHIFVAMTFFNLGMLISFLYSLVFLFGNRHAFPRWLAVPGLINAGLFYWFLHFPAQSTENTEFMEGMQGLTGTRPDFVPMALLEWALVLGIMAWIFILGVYLYTQQNSMND